MNSGRFAPEVLGSKKNDVEYWRIDDRTDDLSYIIDGVGQDHIIVGAEYDHVD